MRKPLSILLRPKNFDEYIGQKEVINDNFKNRIKRGDVPNLIIWGTTWLWKNNSC
jgi:ATPase related to the helicase subunit of the Holliday junction resolvase